MNLYKLKHIPTGLYYTPSKGSGNLSTKGKIYINQKPKLEWCKAIRIKFSSFRAEPKGKHKIICDYFKIDFKNGFVDIYIQTNLEDWVIEELKTN